MSDNKLVSIVIAAAIGMTTAASSAVSAAPFQAPQVSAPDSSIVQAQYRGEGRAYYDNRRRNEFFGGDPMPNQHFGGNYVAGPRGYGNRGYHNNGGYHYYNGHRGYSYYRPGYRRYGEFWFPPAAFALGAIIGGAIAAPNYYDNTYERRVVPAYRSSSSAHVRWCEDRYRTYRASDNTFQPYNGPRQQCHSPY